MAAVPAYYLLRVPRLLRFFFLMLVAIAAPVMAGAATLTVDVRNARGATLQDAVVYVAREGTDYPPAKRTAVMDQKNRTFVPHVLPIQIGTAVQFPNSDDIRHQVYSFSTAKTFQLPLYTGTPSKPIVFDKPGVASLGCNIHDRMSAYIVVVDTPHFAATGKSGRVKLSELPAGTYVVQVWHPSLKAGATPVTLMSNEQRQLALILR